MHVCPHLETRFDVSWGSPDVEYLDGSQIKSYSICFPEKMQHKEQNHPPWKVCVIHTNPFLGLI